MPVRRLVAFLAIFSLGTAAGWALLRATIPQTVGNEVARNRALAVLNKLPADTGIGDNRVAQAVRRIGPAVVNIDTMGREKGEDRRGAYVDREIHGKGAGVLLTPDGYIITNSHVINGAVRIRVTLSTGQWYYAQRVGEDVQSDLAVVRIQASNLPAAELGDSDQLQVGEWSIAVGNPLGLGSTATLGIISALNRHNLQVEEGRRLDDAIQTDAPINRGNSGGALANINGQLIGINTAILSSGQGGGSIGLGFAIPVNSVRRIARDLIAHGKTPTVVRSHPWMGIAYAAVPESMGRESGIMPFRGVVIQWVIPGSPAGMSGLCVNDILLSIDGKEIGEEKDVRDAVAQRKVGDKARLRVLRCATHTQQDIAVTLQEKPQYPPPGP